MKKILPLLLAITLLLLSGCAPTDKQEQPKANESEITSGEFTDDEQKHISELLKTKYEESNGDVYIDHAPTIDGNVDIKQTYEFSFSASMFYNYTQELASGDIENVIIKDEKELYPDSNEEYVYMFLFYIESADIITRFEIMSVNIENGLANLQINLHGGGGNDAFTTYMIVLKIDKNSLSGDIEKIHVDLNKDNLSTT